MRSQALATPVAGGVTLILAVAFLRHGGHIGSVLVAGAVGQALLALFYFLVLRRNVSRRVGSAGQPVGWRRLLVYASGWLPSLLIASAVGLQFESLFLTRFWGTTQVAFYDTGYNIPQRLVALIPSLLTGAWVVGTLEHAGGEASRLRAAVLAFYKGILLIAFPLAFGAGALLRPVIPLLYTRKLAPAADIAPVALGVGIGLAFAGVLTALRSREDLVVSILGGVTAASFGLALVVATQPNESWSVFYPPLMASGTGPTGRRWPFPGNTVCAALWPRCRSRCCCRWHWPGCDCLFCSLVRSSRRQPGCGWFGSCGSWMPTKCRSYTKAGTRRSVSP